ncbi:MAG: N-acetylmuramoyl-L-alanine amidase [Bradyrhizobium sp.]|jgi:N-acetyl-anhydromuramyl-L-alanine amidase AmpD|nr:N-acetylmuramoyl-L-alanine amidase [Bradyrhizobium sp.]
MGTHDSDGDVEAYRDEDERDEHEILANPNPARSTPDFPEPDDAAPGGGAAFELAVAQRVTVITRPLPSEGVPDCSISIGTAVATTNASGNARIDLSGIADGEHEAVFRAPDTSDAEMGPNFPPDPSKKRVWRSLQGRVTVQNGVIVAASPAEELVVSGNTLRVRLQPAWLKAPIASNRPGAIDMIVIHHTAGKLGGDLNWFLYGNQVSIHYLVAPNGDVYKLVMEDQVAAHAGYSHWQGRDAMNGTSIGIEMSHESGDYPVPQIDAVVALVKKLHLAFPQVPAGRVVGHSDIGICEPTSPKPCDPPSPKRLGRKSSDPGFTFTWTRIEELGLSLQIAPGIVAADMFGGYFQLRPLGAIRSGDIDAAHRYGGEVLNGVTGAVAELQRNLTKIGYFCGAVDGGFGTQTEAALKMFKQHMFSGTRQTPSGKVGRLDLATAEMLKRVLGEVTSALPV